MGNKVGRTRQSATEETNVVNAKVDPKRAALIDKLASRTEFTTEDVSNLYDEFMNIAAETPGTPNCIQREQFLNLFLEQGLHLP